MTLQGFIFIIRILLICLSIGICHELIHFLFAYILKKKNIKIQFRLLFFETSYDNDKRYLSTIIVSAAPAIILFLVGIFINAWFKDMSFYAMMFMVNIFYLLPITQDGKVIMYALIKIRKN